MIRGIGTDIIEVQRIERAIQKYDQRFLNRLFSKEEQIYCKRHRDFTRHFAGRFAAKESIVKALGTGFRNGISWLDIEISNDANGKPIVHLSKALQESYDSPQFMLSISHCHEYATAFAICF